MKSENRDGKPKRSVWVNCTQNLVWQTSVSKLLELRTKSIEESISKFNVECDFLSSTEHSALVSNFESKLQVICAKLKLSSTATASAIIYFKRFFLYETLFENDANSIMLACILLSTKVEEERRLSLDDLITEMEKLGKLKWDRDIIMKAEYKILQTIDFDLILFHPYHSMIAFLSDMTSSKVLTHLIDELNVSAVKWIQKCFLTDIPLIYPPGVIGLASIFLNSNEKCDSYLDSRKLDKVQLLEAFQTIQKMMQPNTVDVAPLQAKLKTIRKMTSKVTVQ